MTADLMDERPVLAWFSAGAPSAVAARLAVHEYGAHNVVVINTDVGAEHPDNARFMREVSDWIGLPIQSIKSTKYANPDEVWRARRYLSGVNGAPCTLELKKKPRWAIQDNYGPQVYGYSSETREQDRARQFREQNPEVTLLTPLIDRGLFKADCLAMVERAGIEIPAMYRLGYRNNNCIGCVKGKMGYWNKIRVDFPEVFASRAALERELDHAICKDDDGPVFLDELDPSRGNYAAEEDIECSLLCAATEAELEAS